MSLEMCFLLSLCIFCFADSCSFPVKFPDLKRKSEFLNAYGLWHPAWWRTRGRSHDSGQLPTGGSSYNPAYLEVGSCKGCSDGLCFAGVTTELSFAFGVTGMFSGASLTQGSLGWVKHTRVFVSSRRVHLIKPGLLGTWRSFRSRAVKNQIVTFTLTLAKINAKIILFKNIHI